MGYPQQLVNTKRLWLVSAVIRQTPTYVRRNPPRVQVQITALWLVASHVAGSVVDKTHTSSQCNSRGSSGRQAAAPPIILVHSVRPCVHEAGKAPSLVPRPLDEVDSGCDDALPPDVRLRGLRTSRLGVAYPACGSVVAESVGKVIEIEDACDAALRLPTRRSLLGSGPSMLARPGALEVQAALLLREKRTFVSRDSFRSHARVRVQPLRNV